MTVKCQGCGRENPDDSSFCNACGKAIKTPLDVRVSEAEGTKACPYCGASNPAVASFCQNCVKAFPTQAPIAAQAPRKLSSRRCWQCGGEVDIFDTVCPTCRCDLTEASVVTSGSSEPSRKPTAAALMFAGAGLLDLISAIMLLTFDEYLPEYAEYGVDVAGLLGVCGALVLIFALCAFVAAFLSYRRERFSLALLTGTLGMLGIGPIYLGSVLSLAGIITLALAKDEFSE